MSSNFQYSGNTRCFPKSAREEVEQSCVIPAEIEKVSKALARILQIFKSKFSLTVKNESAVILRVSNNIQRCGAPENSRGTQRESRPVRRQPMGTEPSARMRQPLSSPPGTRPPCRPLGTPSVTQHSSLPRSPNFFKPFTSMFMKTSTTYVKMVR